MGRFYLLNTKKDIIEFNEDFQRRIVNNNALTKKNLFNEYVNRYKELFCMNTSLMQIEVNNLAKEFMLKLYPAIYSSVDMVTESLMTTTNSQWVEATDRAVLQLHQELSRVCVVKGVESHETIATAMVHEPFRANMDPQTHILYKWICLCDICLSTDFCGHCFFAEHNVDSIYSPHTPIPDATHSRSLSSMDAAYRGTSRRGRPAINTMPTALNSFQQAEL